MHEGARPAVDEDDAELLVGPIGALADESSERRNLGRGHSQYGELASTTNVGIEDTDLAIAGILKSFLARHEAMWYIWSPTARYNSTASAHWEA